MVNARTSSRTCAFSESVRDLVALIHTQIVFGDRDYDGSTGHRTMAGLYASEASMRRPSEQTFHLLDKPSAGPYHFLWSGLFSPAILAAKLRYTKTMNKLPTPNAR
jgi:hypothetical protein